MATLKQIAAQTGFSVSVVSRALSPRPDRHARVAPATRAAIRQAAARLGYRPNRAAEFLKRGQTASLRVFLPHLGHRLMGDFTVGVAAAAEVHGFPVRFSHDHSASSYRGFLKEGPDLSHCGLITFPYFASNDEIQALLEAFREARGKMVVVHTMQEFPGLVRLAIDDVEGGRLAARHLLARDCSDFVGWAMEQGGDAWSYRNLRARGFAEVLAAAGRSCRMVSDTAAGWPDLEARVREASPEAPVGVFASADREAMLLLWRLAQAGCRAGREVLVIGYDDLYLAEFAGPPLTTVHQPMRELGRVAVEKVVHMIYGQAESSATIPPTLVTRESA